MWGGVSLGGIPQTEALIIEHRANPIMVLLSPFYFVLLIV